MLLLNSILALQTPQISSRLPNPVVVDPNLPSTGLRQPQRVIGLSGLDYVRLIRQEEQPKVEIVGLLFRELCTKASERVFRFPTPVFTDYRSE